MKKNILLLSAIAGAMLIGCQNDVIENGLAEGEVNGDVKRVTMSVKDFEWDEQTRTTAELTSTGVAFKWAVGDEIGVFPNVGDQVRFPIEEGAGTANASFNGGGWALKSGYTYVAYYPFNKANYDNGKTAIPMTYAGQTQDGNASLANISKCDYIVSNLSAPEAGEIDFQFLHLSALVRFVLTMPKAGTFTSFKLSTENDVIPVVCNLDLSGATPVVANKTMAKEIEMSLSNITTATDNAIITLYMLLPECNLTGKTIKATIGDYTADLAGKNMKGGKAYSYTATMGMTDPFNGHEYVDLGLPSGTLWATCNIGADKPEDYGDYFAWGATEPWYESGYAQSSSPVWKTGKSEGYCWNNTPYQTANTSNIINWTRWTKYVGSTTSSLKDASATDEDALKTELDLEDDAAHVNWGGDWRMPSQAQLLELGNYCTWTWTTLNGVKGCSVRGTNGNSIFLPAASCRYNSSSPFPGSFGNYWSRSLSTDHSYIAYNIYFESSYWDCCDYYRNYGQSVRAVINNN